MIASVKEFFTLSRAERVVRAFGTQQRTRVQAHIEAGDSRWQAGRRVFRAVPAAVLFRDAVVHYLLAAEIAKGASAEDGPRLEDSLASTMPELASDPARPAADPSDDARVRTALASREPLYFDHLSPEDASRTRWALDRAASTLRRRTEARSLANIQATRWGRRTAVAVILTYLAIVGVRAAVVTPNVALHKPVTPSSVAHVPADGQDLVDGDTGTSFGVHTRVEDSPHVVIDLLDSYRIDRVAVHNRVDGWFDDCLPLVVELSSDGKTYKEIARRETHFDGNPPWIVHASGERARYVRLRVARRSYLALSEVEVFGRRN